MKAKTADGWSTSPMACWPIISPWNYPFSIPMLEIVSGLAVGKRGDAEAFGDDPADRSAHR